MSISKAMNVLPFRCYQFDSFILISFLSAIEQVIICTIVTIIIENKNVQIICTFIINIILIIVIMMM